MNVALSCPHCYSANIERRGYSEGEEPKQRCVCRSCGKWFRVSLTYANEPTWERTAKEIKALLNKDTYIISCAQNNTPIDERFWDGILNLAEYYDAQIIIRPVLYRNPTNLQEFENTDAWWPEQVVPYLAENEIQICNGLRYLGHVGIQATAVNPLTGLESLSQGDSAIVGHAQVQMKTIATPQHTLPKILQTTGSVSVKNYSNTKAGVKGEFHHSLGAVIVEKDKNCFHLRHVVGDDDKEFYDLNLHVTPKGVKKINRVEALATGDTHAVFHSTEVRKATFDDKNSIVNVLRPKIIIRQDLADSYSVSHWHRSRPIVNFKKWVQGTNCLRGELELTARFMEETTPADTENIVIASNHHDHIARWLQEADPKEEPWNAILYHELMLAWLKSIQEEGREDFDPFNYWMESNCTANCKFLTRDEPYMIQDILVSMHGDMGANGSRASLSSLSKLGVKTIVGHTHSPAIEKGCYRIGTSSELKLEYTAGPSSWLNTHCIVSPNGKRQLVNIIHGKWRKARN